MAFTPTAAAGSKIEVNTGSTFVVIEGVEGISEFGADRAWIESVPINATAKYFVADIPDYGEVTLAGERQKSDTGQSFLQATAANTTAAAVPFKVTYSTNDIANFTATVGSFKVSGAKGGTVRFSSKIKLSGAVSWT